MDEKTMNSCILAVGECIYGTQLTLAAINKQGKINKHQASINRSIAIFALVAGIYIWNQNSKIQKLEREIKELKQTEGD